MSEKSPVRVLITGAAGQIGYSIIPMVSNGSVFGLDQPIILHLLDLPQMTAVLEGIQMEIQDCSYPLVKEVKICTEEQPAFTGVNCCFLVGAVPRGPGMERKDLLSRNCKVFASQGRALKAFADPEVRVLVVGNPANTNALICSKFAAPRIKPEQITAMTRLDQNRATAQIAAFNKVPVEQVNGVVIWGNHSSTQVVDLTRVNCQQTRLPIPPADELEKIKLLVSQRGASIIEKRKLSSAMSAAKAAADHMRDFYCGSNGRQTCMGVYTGSADSTEENHVNARAYGASADLIFSLPVVICNKTRQWRVVSKLELDDITKKEIATSNKELVDERDDALKQATDPSHL